MIDFWVNVLPHAFCYLCAVSNETKKKSYLNEQCFSVFLPHILASHNADGSAGSVIIITIVCSLIMHRLAAAILFCCSCIPTLWEWAPPYDDGIGYPVFPVTATSRIFTIDAVFCRRSCCCCFFHYYPTCSCLRVSAVVLECECCTSWKVDGNFACFNLFVLLILKYAINFP